jgi:hypothetical protein
MTVNHARISNQQFSDSLLVNNGGTWWGSIDIQGIILTQVGVDSTMMLFVSSSGSMILVSTMCRHNLHWQPMPFSTDMSVDPSNGMLDREMVI